MPEETEAPRQVRPFTGDRMHFVRSARTDWTYDARAGTLPEDFLQSENWKNIVGGTKKIEARDIIHVECEDRSWLATYTVRDVGPDYLKLALLKPDSDGVCWFDRAVDLPLETATHYVKWGNIGTLHTVQRKSDKKIIEKRFNTPEAAAAWMHKHCADIAA